MTPKEKPKLTRGQQIAAKKLAENNAYLRDLHHNKPHLQQLKERAQEHRVIAQTCYLLNDKYMRSAVIFTEGRYGEIMSFQANEFIKKARSAAASAKHMDEYILYCEKQNEPELAAIVLTQIG